MTNKNVRVKNKVVKMAKGKVQMVLINVIKKSKKGEVPPLLCPCFLPSF
jgi:hypothetical protein